MVIGQHPATEDQLRRELTLVHERGFHGLVTNTMTYDCEATPRIANLQPWWVQLRNDPVTAAAWVVDVIQVIRDTPGMPSDRKVLIQEAAFPSACLPQEAAPGATPEAQKVFFETLIATGEQFVYGFAFDAYFAVKGSPPGGFGGLWDADLGPKPVVEILDLGPYQA